MSAARRPVGDDDGAVARNARSDDRSDALGQHWPCGARAYHLAPLGAHDDGVREGAVRCAPAVGAVGLTSGGCTTCAAHTRYDTPGLRPCALTAGAHTDHGLTVLGRSVASTVQAIRRHLPQQRREGQRAEAQICRAGPSKYGVLTYSRAVPHVGPKHVFSRFQSPTIIINGAVCATWTFAPPPRKNVHVAHSSINQSLAWTRGALCLGLLGGAGP